MSIPRLTEIFEKLLTYDRTGINISRYITDFIFRGFCYSVSQRFTIGAGEYFQLFFDSTECTKAGKRVVVFPPVFSATKGPVDIDFYAATGYTGGTSCLITKRAYYGENNLCTLTYGPTGADKGTLYAQNMIPATRGTGAGTADELEIVFPPNSKILIDFYNNDVLDSVVLFRVIWFEVPA